MDGVDPTLPKRVKPDRAEGSTVAARVDADLQRKVEADLAIWDEYHRRHGYLIDEFREL